MNKKTILFVLLSIIAFFASGCTRNVPPIDSTLPQKPLIEKLPLSVAIYYDDIFRSYESFERPSYPNSMWSFRIKLGPPSVTLFDQIFSEMFEKVIQVDNLPPLLQVEPDINAIIEPKISCLFMSYTPPIALAQVDICYKITLYDLNGTDIAHWIIKGSGSSASQVKGIIPEAIFRDAAQIAMQEVAAQFFTGFCNQRDIKKLFDKECNR